MRCPRCDGTLETFTATMTDSSAVVCESCGFTDISASHRPETSDGESWEQAIEHLDEQRVPPARMVRRGQEVDVTTPAESDSSIDAKRLEDSVLVSPRRADDET